MKKHDQDSLTVSIIFFLAAILLGVMWWGEAESNIKDDEWMDQAYLDAQQPHRVFTDICRMSEDRCYNSAVVTFVLLLKASDACVRPQYQDPNRAHTVVLNSVLAIRHSTDYSGLPPEYTGANMLVYHWYTAKVWEEC